MTAAPRRRDLLMLGTTALAGVAAAGACWPLVASLHAAADVQARRRVYVDLPALRDGPVQVVYPPWLPVLVFARSPRQLAALDRGAVGQAGWVGQAGRSRREPPYAHNWHRSIRPEHMVVAALCGWCFGVVRLTQDELRCPYCPSAFDMAGRRQRGPSARDLAVPPYRYVAPGELEIGQNPPGYAFELEDA